MMLDHSVDTEGKSELGDGCQTFDPKERNNNVWKSSIETGLAKGYGAATDRRRGHDEHRHGRQMYFP